MTSPAMDAVDQVRELVREYFEDHITHARDGAVQHVRGVEATAVDTVEATAEQVTAPHVEATRLDREATADHVVEAGGHAQDAAASAGLAAQHAEGVLHAEARAGEHEDLARGHEDEARVQAEASAGHADRADGHAVVSQEWADSSTTSAALSLVAAATVTQYVGDGRPEGKVAAPVGSIYTDRLATNGAIRWIKASGTGNTGWQVEYGDTGWRRLQPHGPLLTGDGDILFRRTNSTVYVRFVGVGVNEDVGNYSYLTDSGAVPMGFRPEYGGRPLGIMSNPNANPSYLIGIARGSLFRFQSTIPSGPMPGTGAQAITGQFSWATLQTWPTTLPGTPE